MDFCFEGEKDIVVFYTKIFSLSVILLDISVNKIPVKSVHSF